jgi:hypothetical protein
MSALSQLLAMLVDYVPPKYVLPIDELVDLLRSYVTQELVVIPGNDYLPELENFYQHVTELNDELRPYYQAPVQRSPDCLDDDSLTVYDYLLDHWNELYQDLN